MDAIFTPIFLAIQARLTAETDIRFIDIDTGQLADEHPGISYPAVLVSLQRTEWSSMGSNAQIGVMTLLVKVVFDQNSDTWNKVPDTVRKLGLKYYEFEEQVHKSLHGWSPEYNVDDADILADVCGSLQRRADRVDNSRGDLRIRELTYTLTVDDYRTIPIIEYVPITGMSFDGDITLGQEIEL